MRASLSGKEVFKLLFLSAFFVIVGALQLSGDGCPPCNVNTALILQTPQGFTQFGQPKVNVCQDSSWYVSPGQTHPRVWNATRDGIDNWNNATGTGGTRPPLFLIHNQVGWCAVKIVRKTPDQTDAPAAISFDEQTGIWEMRLPAWTVNAWDLEGLQAIIAHELGHTMGLANTRVGTELGLCPQNAYVARDYSIMGAAWYDRVNQVGGVLTQNVQAKDVDAANRKYANNATCSTIPTSLQGGEVPLIAPNLTIEEEQEIQYDVNCYDVYVETTYYNCEGGSCTLLYASIDYLFSYCNKEEPIPEIPAY